MRRGPGAVLGTAAFLLVATLVVGILVLALRPLPTLDADVRLIGMHERGEVVRDAYGVPHLYARNAHDLFYMQGYVLAQDRLFQLDLYRRAAHGTLSEVFGEATISADRLVRTFTLARAAAAELAFLSDEARAAADAFSEGINKYIEQRGDTPPLEFVLLGYRPSAWSALDSLAIMKLQAYDRGINFRTELLRASVAQRLGTPAVDVFFP
ncbi:hypothetical protein BH18CHL2_BH18CHL2_08060 [soil metagenome]